MGWPPTNGTPGGSTASTRRVSTALVLPTSVTTVPGARWGARSRAASGIDADGEGDHDEVGFPRRLGRRGAGLVDGAGRERGAPGLGVARQPPDAPGEAGLLDGAGEGPAHQPQPDDARGSAAL